MRVKCFYQESKIPNKAELISQKVSFVEEQIPFIGEIIREKKESYEENGFKKTRKVTYLKVEKDSYDRIPIPFKPKDRIYIFEKEYRVLNVEEKIENEKFARKVMLNSSLYDRYVTKVLELE